MAVSISSKEFITLFDKPDEIVEITDMVLGEPIIIKSDEFNCVGVILKRCHFNEDLKIISFKRECLGISFHNCDFEDELVLGGLTFAKKPELFSDVIDGISFFSSKIKGGMRIVNCQFEKNITFNSTQFSSCEFRNVITISGSINFYNCEITKTFSLSNVKITGELRLSKCNIFSSIRWSNIFAGFYIFAQNTFEKDVMIWAGEAKSGIIFNDNLINDDFSIDVVPSGGGLSIIGDAFRKSLKIKYFDETNKKYGGPQTIYLKSCNFENQLHIDGVIGQNDKSTLSKITIVSSGKLQGHFYFRGLSIKNQINISGINKDSHIVFDTINCNELSLENFTNYGNLQFINIRSLDSDSSKIFISNSILGQTSFHNASLETFKYVEIINSTVDEIKSTNVKWFDPNLILQKSHDTVDFSRNRDLFRQLKYAMLKQGDRVQALFFKRFEMHALRKQLLTEKGHNGEKAMLWMNGSNDHGQNWIKPMFFGLLFTCLFYSAFIVSTAPELTSHFSFSSVDLIATLGVIPKYAHIALKFLNPTHTYSSLGIDIRDNFWGNLFDIIQRIVISYFIFQTISAFRKYIKE